MKGSEGYWTPRNPLLTQLLPLQLLCGAFRVPSNARKHTKMNQTIIPAFEKLFDRNTQSKSKFQQDSGKDFTSLVGLRHWAHRPACFWFQTHHCKPPSSFCANMGSTFVWFLWVINKIVPFKSKKKRKCQTHRSRVEKWYSGK